MWTCILANKLEKKSTEVNALPIDCCGLNYDLARSCSARQVLFYKNSPELRWIETYKTAPGTGWVHMPHGFGNTDWLPLHPYGDPQQGEVGELETPTEYRVGRRPRPYVRANAPIGTPDEWLNGCTL